MQYEISLPADYDMEIIRERVRTKGHLLDGADGLVFKAYVIRERDSDGSGVNQYAPFYLWEHTQALTGMLRGPGFRGLSADFGRPAVRNWHTLGHTEGPAREAPMTTAVRHVIPIDESEEIGERVERALTELDAVAAAPGVGAAVLGVDPHRWELVRFVLGDRMPPETVHAGGVVYQVLHLSQGSAALDHAEALA